MVNSCWLEDNISHWSKFNIMKKRNNDKEEEKGVSHQTSPIPAHVQMERKRRKNKKKRRKVMTCASLIKQELGWRSQLSQHPLWWSRNNTSHTHSVFISDVLILLCSIKLAVCTFWILHCKFSLFHNYIMVHSILLCAYIYAKLAISFHFVLTQQHLFKIVMPKLCFIIYLF